MNEKKPMIIKMAPTAIPIFFTRPLQLPMKAANMIIDPIAMIGDIDHMFDILSPIRLQILAYFIPYAVLYKRKTFGVDLHNKRFIHGPQAHGYTGYAASQGASHKSHPQLDGSLLVVARIEIVNAETAQE